ncbi:MAG: TlpA disulfide reductase family protein, partial [Campylobacterota bacterium]|nr:TlpA disulfide reductase family protein [Campylobacterota bacterium]
SLIILTGCSDTQESPSQDINKMVAKTSFKLTSLDNETFTIKKKADSFILEEAKGKVVLYDIFGTWCPPCRAEAPHLSRLQEKYQETFKVIGIVIDPNVSNETLKEWADTYGANYSIVNSADNKTVANLMASAVRAGENFPIPLMLMYKDGAYVTHYVGAIPQEMIESDIKRALGQ